MFFSCVYLTLSIIANPKYLFSQLVKLESTSLVSKTAALVTLPATRAAVLLTVVEPFKKRQSRLSTTCTTLKIGLMKENKINIKKLLLCVRTSSLITAVALD